MRYPNNYSIVTYELELERKKRQEHSSTKGASNNNEILDCLRYIFSIINQDNITNSTYKNIDQHLKNIDKNGIKGVINHVVPLSIFNKDIERFVSKEYMLTMKLDGRRSVIFLNPLVKKGYIVEMDGEISILCDYNGSKSIMLLDCEIYNDVIYVFDFIPIYNKDIHLHKRLENNERYTK